MGILLDLNSHGIDAEHERFEGAADLGHVACGLNDTRLKSGRVCHLEHRVDVIQILLPQAKDLDRLRVHGGEVNRGPTGPKEDVTAIGRVQLVPRGHYVDGVHIIM